MRKRFVGLATTVALAVLSAGAPSAFADEQTVATPDATLSVAVDVVSSTQSIDRSSWG